MGVWWDPCLPVHAGSDGQVYRVPLLPLGSAHAMGGRLVGQVVPCSTPSFRLDPWAPSPCPSSLSAGYRQPTGGPSWTFRPRVPRCGFRSAAADIQAGAAAGALSVPGGEALDLVARGGDGAVGDREATSATARPWVSLGGQVLAGTGPAAVNMGGTLYALAVGLDHALWVTRSSDGTRWSGWKVARRPGQRRHLGRPRRAPESRSRSPAGLTMPRGTTLAGRSAASAGLAHPRRQADRRVGRGRRWGGMTWAVSAGHPTTTLASHKRDVACSCGGPGPDSRRTPHGNIKRNLAQGHRCPPLHPRARRLCSPSQRPARPWHGPATFLVSLGTGSH